MSEKKYILKRQWKSKTGLQETLYLGKCNDKIDCIDSKEDALIMSKEDAEAWILILPHGNLWSIEEFKEQAQPKSTEKIEEKTDD